MHWAGHATLRGFWVVAVGGGWQPPTRPCRQAHHHTLPSLHNHNTMQHTMQQAARGLHKGSTGSTRGSSLPAACLRASCCSGPPRQQQQPHASCSSSSRPPWQAQWSTQPRHTTQHHRLRSVRCFSTPGLTPPPPPPSGSSSISWLKDVQAWEPSSSVSSNGSNGSSNSSSSSYHAPRFKQLPEGELSAQASAFDAIIVLAGGLTPDGGLPEWVHRRMDVARDLHLLQGRRPAIVCSGGGTPHKPAVLGASGHVIHESTSGAAYLIATGVVPGAVYKEVSSFDTVGNAFFSLCIHAVPMGWRRLAVVTSDFHMRRSRELFADIYRLAGQSLHGDPHWFSLTFLSASDQGVFDEYVYSARLEKEAGSLAHWQSVAPGLTGWPDVHQWFFAEHLCYAVPRQHEFGKRTIKDQKLLDSY